MDATINFKSKYVDKIVKMTAKLDKDLDDSEDAQIMTLKTTIRMILML